MDQNNTSPANLTQFLYVESDAAIRTATIESLTTLGGPALVPCDSAEAALAQLDRVVLNGIVLDTDPCDEATEELRLRLQVDSALTGLPIVALGAGYCERATTRLAKPYNIWLLLAAIRRLPTCRRTNEVSDCAPQHVVPFPTKTRHALKVLLITEDAEMGYLLHHLLQSEEVTVCQADSVPDAMELICTESPHSLVLIETGVPGQDVHLMRRALSGNPAWRNVPLLVLAQPVGAGQPHLGDVDALAKPFSPSDLVRRVRQYME